MAVNGSNRALSGLSCTIYRGPAIRIRLGIHISGTGRSAAIRSFISVTFPSVKPTGRLVFLQVTAVSTSTELQGIFTCTITNWDQVGGKNQAIVPFLPQPGSGTLAFWETELGITPGPCVSDDNGLLEENEGVDPVLNTPGTIFIYSVGDWIAQKFNADKCKKANCGGVPSNAASACAKTPNKVSFWCDVHGTMTPEEISGVEPTTHTGCPKGAPLDNGKPICTNPKFSFQRVLYDVVPYDKATTDHIPGSESGRPGGLDLENIFGASGYDCSSATAKADVTAYGFENITDCGSTN